MKRKIQIFLFALIIIFIVIFTGIKLRQNNESPENINTGTQENQLVEDINTEMQDSVSLENIDTAIEANTFSNNIVLPKGSTDVDLEEAINNANFGDTIIISNDIKYTEQSFYLGIMIADDKDITIQSDGENTWSLLATDLKRHFYVDGTLTLQNIILEGGNTNWGGITSYGTVNIKEGTIIQNNGAEDGGGIENFGVLNMYGGIIRNNKAWNKGGGIAQENTFNMYSGIIEGNSAPAGGGVYNGRVKHGFFYTIFNMYGGSIRGNTAEVEGGGICSEGKYFPDNIININSIYEPCYITDNKANTRQGGGMYIRDNTVLNITGTNYISNNSSNMSGGGIFIGRTNEVNIVGTNSFLNNSSNEDGGAICLEDDRNYGKLNIAGTNSFLNNIAKGNGGAIYIEELVDYNTTNNVTTDKKTIFRGNKAVKAYAPPIDAEILYPSIGFASTSITSHPLNNYDINYKGEEFTLNVLYNANGGIGSYVGPDIIAGNNDTVLSLTDIGINREEYMFISWNTQADGKRS